MEDVIELKQVLKDKNIDERFGQGEEPCVCHM